MCWKRTRSVLAFISLLSSGTLFGQQPAPKASPPQSPKLCVAAVGNGSLRPILVNEVKDKLVEQLIAAGLNVEPTSTATLVAKSLELSGNNQDSIRLRKCGLMLLTAVDSAKAEGADLQTTPGPTGREAAASSDSDLLLSFALFRRNVRKPLLDTSVAAPNADTPTHAILGVIDKEVEQVSRAIPRK
jgi:hypothetical protein